MAAGFQYFDYTQSGAPALTAAAGKLIALLDWALVGKGGWDKAFTGTNLAAYRSQSGNRFYLRVDDTQATYSRLRGYRTMTAISTGTAQFPTTAQAGGNINTWGLRKQYDTTMPAARYWGIRTNRYFLLIVSVGDIPMLGAEYRAIYAFGDVPSFAEADAFNTVLVGVPFVDSTANPYINAYINGTPQWASGYGSGTTHGCWAGSPNGAVVSPYAPVFVPFMGPDPGMAAHLGRMVISPVLIGSSNTTASPYIYPRANLPNLIQPFGLFSDTGMSSTPCTDQTPFSIGARSFMPLMHSRSAGGQADGVALETTDTDGAL